MASSTKTDGVTLATVAKALGVSRTTVSNAYNRPDQLSPELRERVLETARELGYHGPDRRHLRRAAVLCVRRPGRRALPPGGSAGLRAGGCERARRSTLPDE